MTLWLLQLAIVLCHAAENVYLRRLLFTSRALAWLYRRRGQQMEAEAVELIARSLHVLVPRRHLTKRG